MTAAVVLLGASLAGCLYAYAGYPLLLLALGRVRPRPVARAEVEPSVSVIIAAHDEEATIGRKLRDTSALRYPAGKLEILVASDGSTDRTAAIVRRHARMLAPRVVLLDLPRGGKLAALNAAAARARGDVLVFTDANVTLESDALRALVRPFGDPEVGGVCGEKRVRRAARGDATGEGEGLYWRYESMVKRIESRAGNVYAADGAFYAIRRPLYVPIEDLAQADDIAISARVALGGHRLVYEPAAVCWEEAASDGARELRRKVRVANHTLRAVLGLRRELRRGGLYAVQLVSHKLVRYLVPLFMIVALGSSLTLAPTHPGFAAFAALQVGFYVAACAGALLRSARPGRRRPLSVPYYFCLVNTAALGALVQLARGRRHVTWAPRGGRG